jgi:hypothetical protein
MLLVWTTSLHVWNVRKSVEPRVAYNVEIFVTNNLLQVSFLRYELHCVIKCGHYNIKLITVLAFHILRNDRGKGISIQSLTGL